MSAHFYRLRLIMAVLLATTVPVMATPSTSMAPSSDRGLELYSAYCIGCHGINGQGDGPMASRLAAEFGTKPANLIDSQFQKSRSDADLKKTILSGGANMHRSRLMPAWGGRP